MSKTEVWIPGKAFEAVQRNERYHMPSNSSEKRVREALDSGEKRNKGRGYRVLITIRHDDANTLASIMGDTAQELFRSNAKQADILATTTAAERLAEIGGGEVAVKQQDKQAAALANLAKARQAKTDKAERVRQFVHAEARWLAEYRPLPSVKDQLADPSDSKAAQELVALLAEEDKAVEGAKVLRGRIYRTNNEPEKSRLREQIVALNATRDLIRIDIRQVRLHLATREQQDAATLSLPDPRLFGLTRKDVDKYAEVAA